MTTAVDAPGSQSHRGQRLAGSVAGALGAIAFMAVLALTGPVPISVLAVTVIAAALASQYPAFALSLPLLVAPIALVDVPGAGGLQMVHLACFAAIGGTVVGAITRRLTARPPLPMAAAAALLAAMLISVIFSEFPIAALRATSNHLLGFGLALGTAALVRQSQDATTWLLRAWSLASIAVIAPAIPSAATASVKFGGALVEGRVQGMFTQPNDYGEYALMAVVAASALLVRRQHRADAFLGGAALLIGCVGLAVSFSRGAWLGFGAFAVAACVMYPRLLRWAVPMVVVGVSAIAVGSAAGVPPFPVIAVRLTAAFDGGTNPEDDRPLIYQQAWNILFEHPFTGIGMSSYRQAAAEPGSFFVARDWIHGHSIPLTVGAELGLIGLFAMIFFVLLLGVAVVRQLLALRRAGDRHGQAQLALLAAGLAGIAAHGLMDVVYTNPYLVMLLWSLVGIVAGLAARAPARVTR